MGPWVCTNPTCPELGIEKEGEPPSEVTYPPMMCGWCWQELEWAGEPEPEPPTIDNTLPEPEDA